MKSTDYTVCVTNFQRPEHLRRCLESVKMLPNVVVASYGAGPEHKRIIEEVRPGTRCYVTPNDHGENRLLLQAVALADTKWVVILHDDDQLVPEFESVMNNVNPGDAGFIGWDGLTEWYGKQDSKLVNPWWKKQSGIFPTSPLVGWVTTATGNMVQSPVTMMLRRDVTMAVLSWCEDGLAEFHTRPSMMIGNEIALLFGHLKTSETWYHIAKPLVKFGSWEGSETVKWMDGKNPELVALYDRVRLKFGGEQFIFRHDQIKPIFVHVYTTGGDNPRKPLAMQTWESELRSIEKDWLVVPLCLKSEDMERTSEVFDDPCKMPFVKDLIGKAASFCCNPSDVVMLTNDDVCITESGLRKMVDHTVKMGVSYAHRRTFHEPELQKLGLNSLSRVLSQSEVVKGRRHSGTDVVLCTYRWWEDIGRRNIPDLLIGRQAWDTIFIMIARIFGGGWGFRNTTYHEDHESFWASSIRFTNPGQVHNLSLAKRALKAYRVYDGELEDGVVTRDPCYVHNAPGCDSEPNAPMITYIGGRMGKTLPPQNERVVAPAQKEIVATKTASSMRLTTATIDHAIVYPWKASKATWEELRYSIRSVEKNFADKSCPIYIFGTERPAFLKEKGRIKYVDEWLYAEAVLRGTQVAKKILWMNDDIFLLKPCEWGTFETARHSGTFTAEAVEGWKHDPRANKWRKGLAKAVADLFANGIENPKNFSTHTPYVYEKEKAQEIFNTYGTWEKVPLETLYFNHHKTPCEPIGDFKTRGRSDTATVMNLQVDITQDMKDYLMGLFPAPTPYEFCNPALKMS